MDDRDQVADAIRYTLNSPNEFDSNGEAANVVDGLFAIARAIHRLAKSIETATETLTPKGDDEELS